MWRGDGKELFFKDRISGAPVSVAVAAVGNDFEAGTPQQLPIQATPWPSWGVTGDGKRILLALSPQAAPDAPITVILNWASAVRH